MRASVPEPGRDWAYESLGPGGSSLELWTHWTVVDMLFFGWFLDLPSPSLSAHATRTPRTTVADPDASAFWIKISLIPMGLCAWGYESRN